MRDRQPPRCVRATRTARLLRLPSSFLLLIERREDGDHTRREAETCRKLRVFRPRDASRCLLARQRPPGPGGPQKVHGRCGKDTTVYAEPSRCRSAPPGCAACRRGSTLRTTAGRGLAARIPLREERSRVRPTSGCELVRKGAHWQREAGRACWCQRGESQRGFMTPPRSASHHGPGAVPGRFPLPLPIG